MDVKNHAKTSRQRMLPTVRIFRSSIPEEGHEYKMQLYMRPGTLHRVGPITYRA